MRFIFCYLDRLKRSPSIHNPQSASACIVSEPVGRLTGRQSPIQMCVHYGHFKIVAQSCERQMFYFQQFDAPLYIPSFSSFHYVQIELGAQFGIEWFLLSQWIDKMKMWEGESNRAFGDQRKWFIKNNGHIYSIVYFVRFIFHNASSGSCVSDKMIANACLRCLERK